MGVVGVTTGVDSVEELKSKDRRDPVEGLGCRTRGLTNFLRILKGGGAGNNEVKSAAKGNESAEEVEERGLSSRLVARLWVDWED